jgi:pimeloyl-ACP methyl ester carboxylesterase
MLDIMQKTKAIIVLMTIASFILPIACPSDADMSDRICPDDAIEERGIQSSGSKYVICRQETSSNENLVIWAHGFQDATEPVGIPLNQLIFADVNIPALILDMGFDFATNSYSKTGLAVLQGMDDILDLVDIYSKRFGKPDKTYLTGASEGGLITTLLVEQYPDVFDGGVAACGPIGDFEFQIQYLGDARATLEYFFPGLVDVPDPFWPYTWPSGFEEDWPDIYENDVKPVLFAPENRRKLREWLHVAKLPFEDPNEERFLETAEQSVNDVLNFWAVNLRDAIETLGGLPYGNRFRWYTGASRPLRLNHKVPRVDADPTAIAEMRDFYTPTGVLTNPLMTLHTLFDQQVPYNHERLYSKKNIASASLLKRRLNLPVKRFGHCNFNEQEALLMFALLLVYDGNIDLILGNFPGLADFDQREDNEVRTMNF